MTFTGAIAAVAQGRWDNLKALTGDVTVRDPCLGPTPLVEAVHPWVPFENGQEVAQLLAQMAISGVDAAVAAVPQQQRTRRLRWSPNGFSARSGRP